MDDTAWRGWYSCKVFGIRRCNGIRLISSEHSSAGRHVMSCSTSSAASYIHLQLPVSSCETSSIQCIHPHAQTPQLSLLSLTNIRLRRGQHIPMFDVHLCIALILQQPQTPYLSRARRIVSRRARFFSPVCGLQAQDLGGLDHYTSQQCSHSFPSCRGVALGWFVGSAYLFPMMQTLIVVFQRRHALALPGVVFGIGVDHITCQHLLPEGVAAGGACEGNNSVSGRLQDGPVATSSLPPVRP